MDRVIRWFVRLLHRDRDLCEVNKEGKRQVWDQMMQRVQAERERQTDTGENDMYCKHCGSEIKEGEKFCPKCGAPVGPAGPQPDVNPGNPEGKGDGKRNLIIGIAGAIVILVILIAVIASLRSAGSQAVEESAVETPEVADTETDSPDGTDEGVVSDDPESLIRVSGVQVSADPYAYSLYNAVYGFTENRSHLTADVTNDNDVACALQFAFEYQYYYTDDYGDTQTQTETEYWDYDVAAHESRQISAWLDDSGNEESSYAFTGNYELEVTVRDPEADGEELILPLSAVTRAEVTGQGTHDGNSRDNADAVVDGEYENRLNLIFTVPNDTEEKWYLCDVMYEWYYDGIYVDAAQYGSTYYVKPGEDAVVISDGTYYATDFSHVIDLSSAEVAAKVTVEVTGVGYQPDRTSDRME